VDEIRISSIYDIGKTYQLFAKDYPWYAARINKFIKRASISTPSGTVVPLGRLKINPDELNNLSKGAYVITLKAISKFSFYIACDIIADNVISKMFSREKIETSLLRAGVISTLVHFIGKHAFFTTLTINMIKTETRKNNVLGQNTKQHYLILKYGRFNLGRYYQLVKEYYERNKKNKGKYIIRLSYLSYEPDEVREIFEGVKNQVMNYITQNSTNYEIEKISNKV
jgi:hypothetical protein